MNQPLARRKARKLMQLCYQKWKNQLKCNLWRSVNVRKLSKKNLGWGYLSILSVYLIK